jgi:hypothetical protein
MLTLVAVMMLQFAQAEAASTPPKAAQPSWASATANGAKLAMNVDEPRYCVKEGREYCPTDVGSPRRLCLLRILGKISQPCRTALTLTPTTGGPGGFGRPLDAN